MGMMFRCGAGVRDRAVVAEDAGQVITRARYTLSRMKRSKEKSSYDVVIIGAGAAGLAAAGELARARRSALVLEARDRTGGRIWPVVESGLPVPIELGAEFIHGRAKATFDVLQRAGSAAVDA